ncbi:hypothetical protein CANCADRAFT_127269 [Tortispora caseinolytica NRRL Y-17796]|uniref:Vacuolar protein-sorting-associated protein 36 n=1 Tax=Tortispora caseinolytica NRRL Y-17796 TaxID=767744 RepID=A0A1E4TAC2_9ASCO|nr:hypothetical protein CANCADRAFT_127269 [Tortispora caseinolytica NRRL Y-17796]
METVHKTAGGRPELAVGETSIAMHAGIALYIGDSKTPAFEDGRSYLTDRALYYINDRAALGLPLRSINAAEYSAGILTRSAKITVRIDASGKHKDILQMQWKWVCPICSHVNTADLAADNDNIDITAQRPCVVCGIRSPDTVKASRKPAEIGSTDGATCPRCTFINHPSMPECEICGEPLKSRNLAPKLPPDSFKAILNDQQLHDFSQVTSIRLSFRQGGDKPFYSKLQSALRNISNCNSSTNLATETSIDTGRSTPRLGIHALEQLSLQQRAQTSAILSGALGDLDSLMQHAGKVVEVAQNLAKQMAIAPEGIVPKETQERFLEQASAMSLAVPSSISRNVTSNAHGYYREIARDLAEFLSLPQNSLRNTGGIMGLADLYASYNRARSLDLVSPHDLLHAVEEFKNLDLPVSLTTVAGVKVIQSEADARRAQQNLLKILQECPGSSVIQLAIKSQYSTAVVSAHLQILEDAARVCLDRAPTVLQYYINEFDSFIISRETISA